MATPNLKRYVSREFDQDDIGKFDNDEVNIFLSRSRARNSTINERTYDVTQQASNDGQRRKSDGDDGFVILSLGREDVSEAANFERTEVMSLYPVLATPSNRHSGRGSDTGRSRRSAASRRLASATSSGDSVFDEHDGVCTSEDGGGNVRQSNLIFSTSVQPDKLDTYNHGVKFDLSEEDDSLSDDNKLERLKATHEADKDESDEEETLDPSTRSCYVYTLLGLTCLLVLVSAYMALYLYLQWSRLDDPLTLHSVQETLVEFVLFVLAVLLINSLLIIRIFP